MTWQTCRTSISIILGPYGQHWATANGSEFWFQHARSADYFSNFVCKLSDLTKQCRQLDMNDCRLEKLRRAVDPQSSCLEAQGVKGLQGKICGLNMFIHFILFYTTCSRLYCDLFDIYIQLNKCCYHLAPSSTTLVTASLSYWRALRCPRQVSTWRLMQLVHVRIRPVKTTRTRDPNATAKSNRLLPFFRSSYHFLSLSRPSYLCLKIQTCASSVPFTAIHIPLYGCTRMHISWKEFDKVRAPLQLVFFERNVQPSLLQLIFPVLLGAHRLIATKHRLL
jgi:hypothetical protein